MNVNDVTHRVLAIQSNREIGQPRLDLKMKQQQDLQYETASQDLSKEEIKATVETLNDFLEPSFHDVQFVFHEDLDKYYVTVVDTATEEVIREIPPKKMLDMYAAMVEYMGILVDEKI